MFHLTSPLTTIPGLLHYHHCVAAPTHHPLAQNSSGDHVALIQLRTGDIWWMDDKAPTEDLMAQFSVNANPPLTSYDVALIFWSMNQFAPSKLYDMCMKNLQLLQCFFNIGKMAVHCPHRDCSFHHRSCSFGAGDQPNGLHSACHQQEVVTFHW
jgi:hypothetical protein